MNRTLIKNVIVSVGEKVLLQGWVDTKRDHGKLTFIDLRDRSGKVQCVGFEKMSDLTIQSAVELTGTVKARPERMVNKELPTGTVEIDVEEYTVLGKAEPLPFDIGKKELDLELPTLLDHRGLTLRHPKVQAIFKVQAVIIDSFREFMKSQDFMEFQAPAITPAVAEGGSEVFEVGYFEHKAYLTQSPQLYKQIVMSAFERVFSVNKVFRAEPSITTRHLTEIVSLDAEMAFIKDWKDVRDMADQTVKYIFKQLEEKCQNELALFDVTLPTVIEQTPTMSLKEAQEKIYENSKRDVRNEKDLNPEDEREICDIVKRETGSDLVFIYGYPTKKKPFYVYPNPENPEVNEGMDLLCRGLEWLSGGRRVNDYSQLLDQVREWGMDPEKIKLFLEAFKYGVPPEGGFAFGAERITMQVLGLKNVREAVMFPRDMERVDFRLSSTDNTEQNS
ncbi:MAG: aspartate--tRNA(Asn) ligase [Candidatus Levybacteria bacterium]|nr:aspartate--tRNA(Asn) ligase [Candidatus Levybacteria bacterium]